MDARLLPLFCTLPFVCHCDPVLTISGSVHRTDDAPVAGATVLVDCDEEGEVSAETKDDGNFESDGIATGSKICKGSVAVEGEPSFHFRPSRYCVESDGGDDCKRMKMDLVIEYPVDE